MRKKIFIFSVGLLAVSHISHAFQSSSAVLAVTATIASVCSISQNNIIPFGDYDQSRQIIITTNLTVNCTNGITYAISANIGEGKNASYVHRILTNQNNPEAEDLEYNLFVNANHTTVWGNGALNSVTIAGVGNGINQNIPIYAVIPAGQKFYGARAGEPS